jgi:hypothetical protein
MRFLRLFDKASPELSVKTEENYTRRNSTIYLQGFYHPNKDGKQAVQGIREDPEISARSGYSSEMGYLLFLKCHENNTYR